MPGNPKPRRNKQSIRDRRNHKQFVRAEAMYQEAKEREKSFPAPQQTLKQKIYLRFISLRPVVWVRKFIYFLDKKFYGNA